MSGDDDDKFGNPLRVLMTQAEGGLYSSAQNLLEERVSQDSFILDDDYGGTVHLAIPVVLIRCREKRFFNLLNDVDSHNRGDPDGCRLSFKRRSSGKPVAGGTGGGRAMGRLWMHSKIEAFGILNGVQGVVTGQAERPAN